jgi:hypothetical protein
MGLIPTKWDLALCNEVSASSFCRRRLPVVMVRSKMCGSVRMATKFVQQGHVRVGPEVVKDPALLVTRYAICHTHSTQLGRSVGCCSRTQCVHIISPSLSFLRQLFVLKRQIWKFSLKM